MHSYSIVEAGGRRSCRECSGSIARGTKFLYRSKSGGYVDSYDNFCVKCGIEVLRNEIKGNKEILISLIKLSKWDQ